ncbi:hypothetical protein V502_08400 [Pseudogymnoascus sp. VKM F-4520 (FW-2644)]|nr:hypothetical protein V502_08400 [Pseudogymnoascus sp. VKM F-4520 (FW-2644)]
MCLWWRNREPIESSFDPRFGSAAITAPTSGAFTDPSTAPPLTVAILPAGTADQPPPSPPMSAISHLPKFPNAKPPSLNLTRSNRSSEAPSIPQPLTSKSAQSHHSHHSHHSLSTSTQFSSYNSTPSSPASQLQPSPQWPKTSPGMGRPTSPVPVHQAYIPADQLSIGSKLSPGFSASSAPTPTTNGPRTGNSATTTVSNGWGSAQPSPTNIDARPVPEVPTAGAEHNSAPGGPTAAAATSSVHAAPLWHPGHAGKPPAEQVDEDEQDYASESEAWGSAEAKTGEDVGGEVA